MKRAAIAVLALVLALPGVAAALEVTEGVITTQVANRAPVDSVENYPASAGRLYCFTRIVGAAENTTVTHVWYRGDQEMARIELSVRSGDWRTWSSKTILPEWTGEWRVEVVDSQGQVLKTIPFSLI